VNSGQQFAEDRIACICKIETKEKRKNKKLNLTARDADVGAHS